MGSFSSEKLYGMTIRESATDGSDFTNPDADYRRLFLGEDGQLHVRDSAGAVTDIRGAFHGAKAYNSTTQTMNGSGTNSGNTIVTFDSEEFDTDAFHDTGSNTSRITIPTGLGGYYHVGFLAYGVPPAAGVLFDLYDNGSAATFRAHRVYSDTAQTQTFIGSFILPLVAGHYYEIRCNNPNASTFDIGHASAQVVQTSFWAYLVGV